MAADNDVILFILEWLWVPVLTLVLWMVKKVFVQDTKSAVLEKRVESVEDRCNTADERNEAAHQRIIDKIDRHHASVMERLDRLLKRNGA